MGRTTRAETARRNRYQTPVNRGAYVDGNTVRRLNEIPERRQEAGRNAGYSLSLSLKHSLSCVNRHSRTDRGLWV